MFTRPELCFVYALSVFAAIFAWGARGLAQDRSEPAIKLVQPIDPAVVHQPTVLPDRVILTWTGDPATTQAVTWRSSAEVTRGLAEITLADPGPKLGDNARQVVAVTQSLETDLNVANFHSVNFQELTPSARYAYRVGDGTNWSEWFHFTTASTTPEPFSFIYFGDAQTNIRSMWSRVVREAYRDSPKARFMIHAGDLINKAEADAEWGEWFGAGAWMNAMVPSVPVPGNHEMAKVNLISHRVSHHWRPQFALPENGPEGLEETCFTFVYQGVRIVGMNSNEKLMEQAEWLDRLLTETEESWVICIFHHPIFSTGKNRDNAQLRFVWKPILDKHRVDLVLQGHDHTYGRTGLQTPVAEADLTAGLNTAETFSGTVYVVSVSGPKMYDLQRHPFMLRVAEQTQLYQVVHMAGDKLHYEAYTAVGELYDAFTLHKHPGGINTLTEEVPDTPERLRPPVVLPPAKKAAAALR